jgi:hypothetical protein
LAVSIGSLTTGVRLRIWIGRRLMSPQELVGLPFSGDQARLAFEHSAFRVLGHAVSDRMAPLGAAPATFAESLV